MKIMIAYDNSRNARKALEATLEMFGPLKPLIMLVGVVEETRKALPEGNTEYMRPLPTSSRMYLETDIPTFTITRPKVQKIKNNLPELPQEKKEITFSVRGKNLTRGWILD